MTMTVVPCQSDDEARRDAVPPNTPDKAALPPAKKQLSSTQKVSLARAREKARQSKLAKSQAKADQEKEFARFQEAVTKPASPAKQDSDASMSETESEGSPSPVKKKKHVTSSDSDTSDEEPVDTKQGLADHAALAKAAYVCKGSLMSDTIHP